MNGKLFIFGLVLVISAAVFGCAKKSPVPPDVVNRLKAVVEADGPTAPVDIFSMPGGITPRGTAASKVVVTDIRYQASLPPAKRDLGPIKKGTVFTIIELDLHEGASMASESARIEHWDYKLEGWDAFRAAEPNAVHRAVARLENAGRLLMVVTQNIDGLHTKAGTTAERLVELHGTNSQVECQSCGWSGDPEPAFEFFRSKRKPPLCHACGGFLKPATISFGQSLRPDDLDRAQKAALGCDLVVALGSTLSVYPAAEVPLLAAQRGKPYVIVNSGATEHDHEPSVSLRLEGDVVEIFPAAVDAALQQ